MMVNQISWNEFLITVSCITAGYYLIMMAMICFRQRLMQWGRSCLNAMGPQRNALSQPITTDEVSVLGAIALTDTTTKFEQAVQRAESADIISAPLVAPEEEPEFVVTTENDQLVLYNQLVRDIDTLRAAVTDFSKEECLSMLQIIFQHYAETQDDSLKDRINEHTLNAFSDVKPFVLTHDEVDALWSH